ncbi:MAG: hypothetical protein F4Y26_05810 [Gammaproteobacteria bacterium]|nr:hypothetical protein [Gammaproteobacteria bacterium]
MDLAGADSDRLNQLYSEYVARGQRADWVFEQTETKAHRILMIAVPLGSAGVALIASTAHPSLALQYGTWTAISLLSICSLLALASLWPRRYSRPVGFIADNAEQAKNLNEWLHGAYGKTALQADNIGHMDEAVAINERKNLLKGRLVWWALLLLGTSPAAAGFASWLSLLIGDMPSAFACCP